MFDTELRRKLAWLIAIRAVISTVCSAAATLAQITSPGSFPVDPFFFLIAAHLRADDRLRAARCGSSIGTGGWSTSSWPATR